LKSKNLLSDKYSKSVFDMNYSTKIVNKDQSILENRMVKDHTRYYAGVIENG
jgi:hypothetical protein